MGCVKLRACSASGMFRLEHLNCLEEHIDRLIRSNNPHVLLELAKTYVCLRDALLNNDKHLHVMKMQCFSILESTYAECLQYLLDGLYYHNSK